jgi:hypothetical protein
LFSFYDAAYKEKTILLFVLPIYFLLYSRKRKFIKKDVAFLNIAEDGWLHVEAGPVNSPPTQQQPGTLHVGSIKTGSVKFSRYILDCAGHYEEFFLQSP